MAASVSLVAALAIGMCAAGAAQARPQPSGAAPNRTLSGTVGLGFTNRGGIVCSSSQGTGETTGPTTGTMTITYRGCEIPFVNTKCGNVGAGEIQTNVLTTELGTINAQTGEVGEDFKPASGETDTEFSCGSLAVTVKGSVIGKVVSPNSMTQEQTLVFAVEHLESGFKQVPESFEGMPPDVLSALVENVEEPAFLTTAVHIQNEPVPVSDGARIKDVKDPTEVRVGSSGPEFGRCQRARSGARYTNASCTVAASAATRRGGRGHFEWRPI
jgi:hypothetical protein